MNETREKKLSLTKQSAWLMSAKVIGFVLSFFLPLLTVRFLTQDMVGVYRQIFLVMTNANAILSLGFSMSSYYYLNRESEKRKPAILNILLFNFVMGWLAFLALFLYPQFLGNIFQSEEMTRLAPKIGVVIWLWVFSTFLEVVALANQETKLATAFIVLSQFTKTTLMAGAVVLFATVEAFVNAAIIQAVIQTCILIYYLNSRFPKFWLSFNLQFFREQLFYALPFGLAALLYTIQTDLHNYFVGYRFSEADYAIYAYGCFEIPLIAMLYESFSAVMIPRMNELQSEGKKREMLLTAVSAMQKLAFVYLPLFVFLMIVADLLIPTLFTENYRRSVPIFRINLLLFPFYCLMLDPIARSFKEVGRFLLRIRIFLFFALLGALWFGINHFDLTGMIAIVVVGVLIERILSLTKILKILEARRTDFYLLKNIGKTAISSLFAGLILFVFYWFSKDFLLAVCLNFSRQILELIKFEKVIEFIERLSNDIVDHEMTLIKFEKIADFFGNSFFLGICFVLFATVYIFFANQFGAIESDDKNALKTAIGNWRAKVENLINRKKGENTNAELFKNHETLAGDEPHPLTTDH